MSRKVVAKFGGTSVKTAAAIQRVSEIIAANPHISVVVVSAVGGVTNLLVELCHVTPLERPALIQVILDIHLQLSHALGMNLTSEITHAMHKLNAIANTHHLEKDHIDMVLALGEDLSSLIVHAYFCTRGIHCHHLDARQYLITDSYFGKAVPDTLALKRYAFPTELWVTQGFIGSTPDGRTTTLGRGGSDYSAALIAEAMGADELLIYTDVPGVYTMDPHIVLEARLIPELSFHEMAEMANFGTKILHPATLEPCVRARMPVRILSSFEPEKQGTFIDVTEEHDKHHYPTIRAITMRKGQVLVTIKSLKMLNAYGFLANIFSVLAKHKISVDLITTSEVSVALTIDSLSTGSHDINLFLQNETLLDELKVFAEVIIEADLTLIAVIGSGLTIPGLIQKTLGVIEPYTLRMVCYGASNSSISILASKDKAIHMIQMLHQQLLGEDVYV